MADLSVAKKSDLESFKNNANDVIYFKLGRKEEDIEDESKNFHPDMSHQLFGDSELIFGYKNLNVHIYYTAARLIPYLNISYSESCHEDQHGIKPDDVEKSLSNELPPNYFTNLDTFRVALSEDVNFRPFGHMVDSYTLTPKNSEEKHFEVYYVKIEEPGFRDFHVKLQSFIKFYIDAASYIDVDDQQWDFFLVFEKYKENGEHKYATAGYMTVYNLNIPFLRNRRTYKKLEKSLSDEELSQTLGLMKKEQKFQYLENAFQEELNSYQHVLDRLSTFQ
ncbi:histone acetyltransferase type B catalytic subunit-like [Biomphalaria glabrata]|uniref:histone acetyltransferase n=1 Tax=Biomphalaria glabrata TaxID=6526 RepID=A0A9W3AT32_BIOGL|nr:histone acetyltransferase type B catalytic subunit-like [Biomphalaria glabrata]